MIEQTPTPSYIGTPTALPPAERPRGAEARTVPAAPRGRRLQGGRPAPVAELRVVTLPKATKRKRYRSTADVMGAAQRLIAALGRRVGNGETDDADGADKDGLKALMALEKAVQEATADAVERLRQSGVTDGEIAKMLGVKRPAVSKRWPGHGRYLGAAARFGKRAAPAPEAGKP